MNAPDERRATRAMKCAKDVGSVPLEVYRLESDGPKWRPVCRLRKEVLLVMALAANGNGTSVKVSVPSIMRLCAMSRSNVFVVLHDLKRLGFLVDTDLLDPVYKTRVRAIDIEKVLASASPVQNSSAPVQNSRAPVQNTRRTLPCLPHFTEKEKNTGSTVRAPLRGPQSSNGERQDIPSAAAFLELKRIWRQVQLPDESTKDLNPRLRGLWVLTPTEWCDQERLKVIEYASDLARSVTEDRDLRFQIAAHTIRQIVAERRGAA